MSIELEKRIIHIFTLDRERKINKMIYHNPSFPTDLSIIDGMKVTIYEIKNNKEILLFKDMTPSFFDNKLLGFKKLRLVFTQKMDLINFKFNLNWSLIF